MAGRRLGQHFLHSASILRQIAEAAAPEPGLTILEIGPGRGALTGPLLERAARVIAIEIDPVLTHYLQQRFQAESRLTLLSADVLKTDLSQWGPVALAGNLPYYITSPILERAVRLGPLLRRAVFLVQKEVAERVVAAPGTRDYGFLSVQTQLLAKVEILLDVPPGAFSPPPKVHSAVLVLEPREGPAVTDFSQFLEFAGRCFRMKRKTLRNNLRPFFPASLVDELPEGGKRAEQLAPEQLLELHQRILRLS